MAVTSKTCLSKFENHQLSIEIDCSIEYEIHSFYALNDALIIFSML